jgi:ankyrin repeat protein
MKSHSGIPDPITPSSLSLSIPIHAALQRKDVEMLEYLLAKGFDINTRPLANPTRCFTPIMTTAIYPKTFNKVAFDLLAASPCINFNIRTPVYRVHLLHAVATLNLSILKHIARKVPLKNAGKTKLGHTLLHIACLPADAQEVQYHSLAIFRSIHETRDLHAHNDPHMELSGGMRFDPGVSEEELKIQAAQTEVVKYLCDNGIYQVWEKDVHGNTPFHYLVGC